jgi:hypothetical protein
VEEVEEEVDDVLLTPSVLRIVMASFVPQQVILLIPQHQAVESELPQGVTARSPKLFYINMTGQQCNHSITTSGPITYGRAPVE